MRGQALDCPPRVARLKSFEDLQGRKGRDFESGRYDPYQGTASAVPHDAKNKAALAAEGTLTNLLKQMTSKHPILRRALHGALLMPLIVALLGAGDPTSRFNDIGHQLMCICGCGQILLECNHVGCPDSDGMRNELMAAVTRGDSDSLVQQAFVQKYGPTVLAAPTTKGFDRTAWVFPFVAFAFGVIGVVMVVRAWRNRPAPAPAGGAPGASNSDLEKFREQAREETDL